MIIQPNENLMSLPQAAKVLNCSRQSVYLYASKGHGGRKLETVKVGSRMKTTLSAINRFIGAGTGAATQVESADDVFGMWNGATVEQET